MKPYASSVIAIGAPVTTIESLYLHGRERATRPALLYEGRRLSYGGLLAGVERYARSLLKRGVRPGDRVALQMGNSIEAVLVSLGCLRIGAILAPLSVRLTEVELGALLSRLRPVLFFAEETRASRLGCLDPKIVRYDARYFLGRAVTDSFGVRWEDFLVDDADGSLPDHPDRTAAAVLLLTSGTTAEPRFVAHTLQSLSHALDTYVLLRSDDDARPVMMVGTPFSHASGFITTLLSIRFGTRLRLLQTVDADACLDAIEIDRCSWFIGAPYLFAELLACQRVRPRDADSLKFCLAVGDVCPAGLQHQFQETFGVELRTAWGATEVMGAVLHGPPGASGRRGPAAQLRVVDEHGAEVAAGEVGELEVRGPSVAVGYWLAPGRIDPARRQGWFATGDLMWLEPTGELWFAARKKDLIIRGGINVSPVEVEAVLLSHPLVHEAAVAGAPDPVLGQVVVAAVRLVASAGANSIDDILSMARDRLADYKVPTRVRRVKALPRNPQGKIDRRALARLLADQSSG
jgi:long-chain acyl-CoA synthetase